MGKKLVITGTTYEDGSVLRDWNTGDVVCTIAEYEKMKDSTPDKGIKLTQKVNNEGYRESNEDDLSILKGIILQIEPIICKYSARAILDTAFTLLTRSYYMTGEMLYDNDPITADAVMEKFKQDMLKELQEKTVYEHKPELGRLTIKRTQSVEEITGI